MNGLEAFKTSDCSGDKIISPSGKRCFRKNGILYYSKQPKLPVNCEALEQEGWSIETPLMSLHNAMNESDCEMVKYYPKDDGDMRIYSFSDHITLYMVIEKSWRPLKKEPWCIF